MREEPGVRADFAKVLYVVAHDKVEGRRSDVRGPQAGHGLTKRQITDELVRHFGAKESPDRKVIDDACAVLLRQNYFELKGGKSGKRYLLHEKYTEPTLILDRVDAKIVLAISELADMEDRFPLAAAIRKCATDASITEDEVRTRIQARSETVSGIIGYFQKVQTDTYELNSKTVEEERPYLELVAKFGLRTPKPGRGQPSTMAKRPVSKEMKQKKSKNENKARSANKPRRRS